jgi:hypothetical protein
MKRIFTLAIVMLLYFSAFSVLAPLTGAERVILSQNFDGEPTGSTPQEWVVENPSICSLTVDDTAYYGVSGKSAKFVDSTYGFSYVGRTFSPQNGLLAVEFAMMAEVPDYLMLYIDDGIAPYGTPSGANIYFMPNGYLAYYDDLGWNYLCPFSVKAWQRIEMAINVKTNTYDIRINGSLMAKDVRFRGFGSVTQIARIHFGATSLGRPVGYIDQIAVKAAQPILAKIDIKPDALNLNGKGWITCYIELPECYNVSDINVYSIMLNDTLPVDIEAPTALGDYDNDTIPDFMVKFDRAEVISYILANINVVKLFGERFRTVTLTVTGKLYDGTPFQGSDTIRIFMPTYGRIWRYKAKLA